MNSKIKEQIELRIKQLQERISDDRIINRGGDYFCKFCEENIRDCFCSDDAKLELEGINFVLKKLK